MRVVAGVVVEPKEKNKYCLHNKCIYCKGSLNTQLITKKLAINILIFTEPYDYNPLSPGKQDTDPLQDQKYFDGGYNTKRYTSEAYPNVFGLQIETNMPCPGERKPSVICELSC